MKKYDWEFVLLNKIRKFSDGIIFFLLEINLDLFKADHSPAFKFNVVFLNYMIIEINIYSLNHTNHKKL